MNRIELKILATGLLASVSSAAFAQAATAPTEVEDIIVTAQRRSQNVQEVPITITTVTSTKLEAAGIQSTLDLAQVTPGLSLPANVGRVVPRIRGVGTSVNGPGLENSVAVYVDDVYVASSSASIFALSSVQRVEVLKGPQGTLFGRNATGGVVHVITKDPSSTPGGNVSVSYGNYNTVKADGYVTGGLASGVSADFAWYVSNQGDGYGTNFPTGQDVNRTQLDLALRSKLLFDLGASTTLKLSGDYSKMRTSDGASLRPAKGALSSQGPALAAGDPWDAALSQIPLLVTTSWGGSAILDHDFDFARFTSITAYREANYGRVFDLDQIPIVALDSVFSSQSQQTSQEFHLSSLPGGKLTWLVGAFLFNIDDQLDPARTNINPAGPGYSAANRRVATILTERLNTRSAAGFAQATLALGPSTSITGGVRYTYERRTVKGQQDALLIDGSDTIILGPLDRKTSFDKLTWRASIDQHLSKDVLVYASFNTGFKSGGFNSGAPGDPAFLPETLTAYEVGAKTEFFDRRLRLNTSVFYYDYKNIQVTRRDSGLTTVFNGAASTIYGLDVDFDAVLSSRLTLSGGLELLHDRFTSFPQALSLVPVTCPTTPTITDGYISCLNAGRFVGGSTAGAVDAKGNRLPYTSDATFSLTADYHVPLGSGELSASATYAYTSGYYPDPDNIRKQAGYSNLSASLLWKTGNERFSVRLWGRNLTNAAVVQNFASQSFLDAVAYAPPRTFGVTLGTKF